jgi:hypothetical protein
MADELTHLSLPFGLCRDVRLLGGTSLSLKALLSLEDWRELGELDVTLPVDRLADHMGCRHENVRKAVERLGSMEAATHDGAAWIRHTILEPGAPIVVGRGTEAEVTVRVTAAWNVVCDADPDVLVPLADVRALTTRTGLLLRLRAAAALHGRTARTDPRLRFSTSDFPHYTGYDGAGSPNTILKQLLQPGFEDVNANSSTVELRMRTANRDGEKTRSWLRHVEWTVVPLRSREVVGVR